MNSGIRACVRVAWLTAGLGLWCGVAAAADVSGDIATWLVHPLSSAENHVISLPVAWHGRLMVLAWAVLVPAGVLVARFYKVTPGQAWPDDLDNTFWWYSHLTLMSGALVAMAGAVGLMLLGSDEPTRVPGSWLHRALGWLVVAGAGVQALGGLLRGSKGGPGEPGDHFSMTRRRRVFERVHKFGGLLVVGASCVTIALGLWVVAAPRWMGFAIGAWWITLAGCFLRLQREGRCVDTYQAIWGPAPEHPGACWPSIGWGIRRYRPGQQPHSPAPGDSRR